MLKFYFYFAHDDTERGAMGIDAEDWAEASLKAHAKLNKEVAELPAKIRKGIKLKHIEYCDDKGVFRKVDVGYC